MISPERDEGRGLVAAEKLKDVRHSVTYITGRGTKRVLLLLFSSRSVVSNSLQPHELQHTRLSCPSSLLEFAQTHVH